ncbi:hypothetical protein D3C71_701540 [compost metagenome]
MLFRKKYSFQLNQNKDDLTQTLKNLSSKDLVEKNEIGVESSYSVEFNWDEFIVTRKPKLFERGSFTPNAHIRLASLSENLTQIDVKIKLSEIWWILLVFIHLGIVAGYFFTPSSVKFFGNPIELNWLSRIAFLLGITGFLNFIIWLIFINESKNLKKIINRLFEQTI